MKEEPAVWEYTFSPVESERWHAGDVEERRELLEEMGPKLVRQAQEHGCNCFTISDWDGRVIAEGTWGYRGLPSEGMRPYEADDYPAQNRRN